MLDKLREIEARLAEVERQLGDSAVYTDREKLRTLSREQKELTPVVAAYREYRDAEARIAEAEEIVKAAPGLTAYDITGKMHWHIRARNWDDFPPGQKVFAISEAIAHLDTLVAQSRIKRVTDEAGLVRYY